MANLNKLPEQTEKVSHAEFKGTKGEWKVVDWGHCLAIESPMHTICTDQFCHAPKEEQEANVKLISMAPELLHQLQTAIKHLKNIQEKYKPEVPFAIGGYELTVKKALS